MYNLELRPIRRHFLNTEFDKLFETNFTPPYDVHDDEKHFSISLDIPGVKKDDINLEVKDNHLYVTGERKSERRGGKFSRVFTLPQNVNPDAIKATFENGVLELTLPKEEKAQARKITISDWKDADLKS